MVQWRSQPLGSEVDGTFGAPLVAVVIVVALEVDWSVVTEVGLLAVGVPLAAGGVTAGGVMAGGVTAGGVTAGLGLAEVVALGLPTVTSGFSGFPGEDVVSVDDAIPMEYDL